MRTLVNGLEIDADKLVERLTLKSTSRGSVITHAGLGNQKVGVKEFGYQEQIGVTFVVVDGQDWHIRPMVRGIGMDESRRRHEAQIQDALDMDEMKYYSPLDEYDFTQSMVDWSRMDKAPIPAKFKAARMQQNPVRESGEFDGLFEPQNTKPFVKVGRDVGRNESCPCGSGKKYKKCCGS